MKFVVGRRKKEDSSVEYGGQLLLLMLLLLLLLLLLMLLMLLLLGEERKKTPPLSTGGAVDSDKGLRCLFGENLLKDSNLKTMNKCCRSNDFVSKLKKSTTLPLSFLTEVLL